MYRKRSYPRRAPIAKRRPYAKNIEVIQFSADISAVQYTNQIYVQQTSVIGKTTFARPKININVQATNPILVYWALVYVPDGYGANTLSVTNGADLYEPAQFVMAQGSFIADTDAQPFRLTSPLKRLLNESDQIILLMRSGAAGTIQCAGTVEYFVRN